jgi:NDP-sugar pyrophosphorylase family protein
MVLTKTQAGKFSPVFADDQGRVRGIGRGADSAGLSAHNFCGVQLINRELLDYLPEGFSKMIEDGYLKALSEGREIRGYLFPGLWLSIDTPGARRDAEKELSMRKLQFPDKSGGR